MAERWGRWWLFLDILSVQIFCFCSSNVTTFATSRKCKNFNFSLYPVPAEMLYLQKYFINFQKRFLGWKTRKGAVVVDNFKCTDILFWNSNFTTFPTSRKCKNFNFSLHTVQAEMLNLRKYLTNFQKLFFLKDEEGGYWGWKFQEHRHFAFSVATLPLFQHPENVKISIFPFTLSQQKCLSSKVFNKFSKTFFWLKDKEGGCCGWQFQVHR